MMAQILRKQLFGLLTLLMAIWSSSAHADPASYNADEGYQGNSFIEYEEFQKYGGGYTDCFSSGKVFSDPSALVNVSLPKNIGRNVPDTDSSNVQSTQTGLQIGRAVGYAAAGIASLGIAFIAAAIDYSIMVDVCSNAYVLTAAERVTLNAFPDPEVPGDNICIEDGKQLKIDPKKLKSGKVYTSNEIPYLFHCKPYWDPAENNGNGGNTSDPLKVGRTYGYAGGTSPACNLDIPTKTLDSMEKNLDSIVVGYWPKISRGWYSFWTGDMSCRPDNHTFGQLRAGDEKYIRTIHFYAFYWQQPRTGKIRLCAIAPYTMFPVLAGCSTIAPPVDLLNTDSFIQNYVAGTRCAYLLKARDDLNSLGKAALNGVKDASVNKFLRSDLHMTSTVVGCVKDMLTQIFTTSLDGNKKQGKKPFFQVVQERMKMMVLGALTLYVALVGIKIMTAGQPPSRAEGVMYVLKFALVLYFATGDVWYNNQFRLFPSMLQVSEDLSSIFLEAQNINDPLSACRMEYQGSNIFSNRDIPASGIAGGTATEGYQGVIKTTVWDLVDCKVVNYLSFGSCNYTVGGMMSSWLFSGFLAVDFSLAVCCLIYTIMILITVFRFAHIYILSIFTITILVFLSPLFLCFALFEPTKNIFNKWMQMLIGYMIYPALLFAFVAIMFATFDAVFYGNLNLANNPNPTTALAEVCKDVDSIFCKNMSEIGYVDPCTASPALLTTNKIKSERIPAFGTFKKVDSAYAGKIRNPVMRLLLFSFLFYLFLGSVTEFMAILVGVQGLGQVSQGLGAGLKPLGMAAGAGAKLAANKAAGGIASGVGKLAGKMRS